MGWSDVRYGVNSLSSELLFAIHLFSMHFSRVTLIFLSLSCGRSLALDLYYDDLSGAMPGEGWSLPSPAPVESTTVTTRKETTLHWPAATHTQDTQSTLSDPLSADAIILREHETQNEVARGEDKAALSLGDTAESNDLQQRAQEVHVETERDRDDAHKAFESAVNSEMGRESLDAADHEVTWVDLGLLGRLDVQRSNGSADDVVSGRAR